MRLLIVGLLSGLVLHPGLVAAQTSPGRASTPHTRLSASTPLADTMARAVARELARASAVPAAQAPEGARAEPQRSWISRHPALFGAMVGAGGGAVVGATAGHECSDESWCQRGATTAMGAGIGAGVGALIGWGIGLGAK